MHTREHISLSAVIVFALAFSLPAHAQPPAPTMDQRMSVDFFHLLESGVDTKGDLSEGMQEALPLDYVQTADFLPFKNFRTRPKAPIAVEVFFNGTAVQAADIHRVFTEDLLARIPAGEGIRTSQDSQGRTVWDYPRGTQVAHFITLNAKEESPLNIFEFRVAEKMEGRRWAFGVYRPEDGALRLQHYAGFLKESFTVDTSAEGKVAVDLKHIPLQSCRNCHARTTSARYQYPTHEDVGPCEFTPPNPHIEKEWAPLFQRRNGYPPITP